MAVLPLVLLILAIPVQESRVNAPVYAEMESLIRENNVILALQEVNLAHVQQAATTRMHVQQILYLMMDLAAYLVRIRYHTVQVAQHQIVAVRWGRMLATT